MSFLKDVSDEAIDLPSFVIKLIANKVIVAYWDIFQSILMPHFVVTDHCACTPKLDSGARDCDVAEHLFSSQRCWTQKITLLEEFDETHITVRVTYVFWCDIYNFCAGQCKVETK